MDGKKLDLNLLLALEALLAEENVTRAAKRLNLSQPALSAQLSRLRNIFQDDLFIPTSRGMSPTALASELRTPLRAALDETRSLISRAQTFDAASANVTMTISSSDYMQIAILLPFLVQMNEAAPGIRVMMKLGEINAAESGLERGDVDIAFIQSGDVDGPHLQAVEVLQERYIGIARKGSVGAAGMSLDRFISLRHVIVSPRAEGFKGPTDEALHAMGLARHVGFAVSSFVFMIEAVAQSDLIALAPERLARRYAERVDIFEPPVPVAGFAMSMVWHDRTRDHPARAWLRERLKLFCQQH